MSANGKTNGEKPIKALAALEKGTTLKDFEYTPEPLGTDDIEIAVLFNGLCHSDLHVITEDWGPVPFPKVPGHEIVGKVTQKGSSVKHLKEGDLVGVGWFKSCCLECYACVCGDDNCCPQAVATIMGPSQGGFAEHFRCHSAVAVKVPDGIEPADVAPLMCAGITVWSPISRTVTKPGMKVGVIGLGGLGHLALQFARAVGAEVYAISGSKKKEAEAKKLGAHHFTSLDDLPDETLDVLLNTTPEGLDITKAVNKLAYNGHLVMLGGGTQMLDVAVFPMVLKQRTISGSAVGGRRSFREMLRIVDLHNVRPMCEIMPLADANKAFDKLANGSPHYRIVLETGDYFSKQAATK